MKRMKGEDCASSEDNGKEDRCDTGDSENRMDFSSMKCKRFS